MFIHEFDRIPFEHVTKISPITEENNRIKKYFSYKRYSKKDQKDLHKHGEGPFCKFKISNEYKKNGSYIITIDDEIKYIGECQNLSKRYNMGYGNISPRNCFKGGQLTNCRINNKIYKEITNNKIINLFFRATNDRHNLESFLIERFDPPWNKTRGKKLESKDIPIDYQNTKSFNNEKSQKKYKSLENYLINNKSNKIILSYKEIENIINDHLPNSAHKYKAWWSNGGHIQAESWIKAGWKVIDIKLNKNITFKNNK
jgi:hypothetical protein